MRKTAKMLTLILKCDLVYVRHDDFTSVARNPGDVQIQWGTNQIVSVFNWNATKTALNLVYRYDKDTNSYYDVNNHKVGEGN